VKIGIITFHHVDNFGALLQCLSLTQALQEMGHDVQVINHQSSTSLLRSGLRHDLSSWSHLTNRLRGLIHGNKLHASFDYFRRHSLPLTPLCDTESQLAQVANTFDALVVGSDQVWHFSREPKYFFNWHPPFPNRRIAYAACCGSDIQPDADKAFLSACLKKFNFISVRNDFSANFIHRISGTLPEVVCDPVLLVDPSPWGTPPPLRAGSYLLNYRLGPPILGGEEAFMKHLQDENKGPPWVWINGQSRAIHSPPPAEHKIWHSSPKEWLGWIQNCRFLLTDSFHAILYALKFRKPFLGYFTEPFRSARLMDLSKRYGLTAHIVGSVAEALRASNLQPTEFSDQSIQSHVSESRLFLHRVTSFPLK
jgi:Polysaccharide pyruvyl transferase